jgi:hypothetical protein
MSEIHPVEPFFLLYLYVLTYSNLTAKAWAKVKRAVDTFIYNLSMVKMSQDSAHICFYSNGCPWSKAFIEEIAKTPWKKEFRYICVDPGPNRPALPKFLKQTPTLVIRGEKEPRVDAEVMNWIYERRLRETQATQGQQRRADPAAAGGEPDAWNTAELGSGLGSGDSFYSFLSADTSTAGDGGASLPGTFSFLNGAAAPGGTAPGTSGAASGAAKTRREQMFDQQMEEYMSNRNSGMPKGPVRQ